MSEVLEHVAEDGRDNEFDCAYTPDKVTGHVDQQIQCDCIPVNRRDTGPIETKKRHRILQTPPDNVICASNHEPR